MSYKYGKTLYEYRVVDAFKDMQLPVKQDQIVCFMCGSYFQNLTPNQYPHTCGNCSYQFDGKLQYCMPDVLIPFGSDKAAAVIFVNGMVHDKINVKRKDNLQIKLLKNLGYTVYTIRNEMIVHMEKANLCLWCFGVYNSFTHPEWYKLAFAGEKELPH